jgi:hypothetical protein
MCFFYTLNNYQIISLFIGGCHEIVRIAALHAEFIHPILVHVVCSYFKGKRLILGYETFRVWSLTALIHQFALRLTTKSCLLFLILAEEVGELE